MLLATVAGSKVYPGRLHVLMIDRSLAPCRNAYMRPENMDIGSGVVCIGKYIYIFEFFHYTNPAVLPILGQHMFVPHQGFLLDLWTFFKYKMCNFTSFVDVNVEFCATSLHLLQFTALKKGNDVKLCYRTYLDMTSFCLVMVLTWVVLFYRCSWQKL